MPDTAFYNSAIKDWNEFPLSIKETKGKDVFRQMSRNSCYKKGFQSKIVNFIFIDRNSSIFYIVISFICHIFIGKM